MSSETQFTVHIDNSSTGYNDNTAMSSMASINVTGRQMSFLWLSPLLSRTTISVIGTYID